MFSGLPSSLLRSYAETGKSRAPITLRPLFPDKFKSIVTQCFMENKTSFDKLFSDPDFYQKVQEAMAQELYRALRKD